MKILIEIQTHDRALDFEIRDAMKNNAVIEFDDGSKLEYDGAIIRKSFNIPQLLQFIVDASINAEQTLVLAWLYDKVKDKKIETITINSRIVTEITEKGIRQVFEEEIKNTKE